MTNIPIFQLDYKYHSLGRRLSRIVVRDAIRGFFNGVPITEAKIVRRLRLRHKRPTVRQAVLAAVMGSLRERGIPTSRKAA